MNNQEMTQILVQLRDGQEVESGRMEAFGKELRRQVSRYGYCGDFRAEWDEEDFVQDVFLAMLKALHGYDETKAGFSTWIRRVSLSVAGKKHTKIQNRDNAMPRADAIRVDDEGNEEVLVENAGGVGNLDVESVYFRRMALKKLYAAMETLPEDQKEAIRLVDLAGYELEEAAQRMNCKSADISRWRFRGRKKLRAMLDEQELTQDLLEGAKRSYTFGAGKQ